MRIDSREMLAVGILGQSSQLRGRIEILMRGRHAFTTRASVKGVSAGAIVLCGLMLASSLVPRWIAFAQTAPRYEVASIKPNADGDFGYRFSIESNGTLFATGITLRRLMMTAYQVQGFRILGGPEWVSSGRWDLQAKSEGSPSPEQIHLMLRTLLEERFQMRWHFEKRQLPVYRLGVDRRGAKIPAVKNSGAEPTFQSGSGLLRMTNVTSATFASQLQYSLGRTLIDETGLSGSFDFALEWTPEPGESGGPITGGLPPGTPRGDPVTPDGPSIFTAIREQLGLELKSGTGPVEVVVIDHVEKPDAN